MKRKKMKKKKKKGKRLTFLMWFGSVCVCSLWTRYSAPLCYCSSVLFFLSSLEGAIENECVKEREEGVPFIWTAKKE